MTLPVDLKGQAGVVTGSSSGIGAATVRALVERGARVYGWDVTEPPAEIVAELAAALAASSGGFEHRTVDMRDEAAIAQAVRHATNGGSGIEFLVYSAGTVKRGAAVDLAAADWDLVHGVNLRGAFLCSRALAPHMTNGGAIVAVASIMGFSGGLYPNAAYQASKGGLVNLVRALAIEWAPQGIRVNGVAPTFTETPFIDGLVADPERVRRAIDATPLRRFARAEEIADAALFLLSEHASMITGHTLPVDGGFLAV